MGAMLNSLRTWWLALDRHWGTFIIADHPASAPGLSRRTSPAWSIASISSSSWRAARDTCWLTTISLPKI